MVKTADGRLMVEWHNAELTSSASALRSDVDRLVSRPMFKGLEVQASAWKWSVMHLSARDDELFACTNAVRTSRCVWKHTVADIPSLTAYTLATSLCSRLAHR